MARAGSVRTDREDRRRDRGRRETGARPGRLGCRNLRRRRRTARPCARGPEMRGGTFGAVLAVLMLVGLGPVSPRPDPGLRYAVAGAGPLVLREGPYPGAPAAGTLSPADRDLVLTGRWVMGADGPFWEVLRPDEVARPAWAAAARLTPGAADPGPFPLQCSGTEPFWGLRLTAGRARMSRPGQADSFLRVGARRGASGDPRVFVQNLTGPRRGPGQVMVIRRAAGCSDGMSDLAYPFETVVTTPSGEVLTGCCRRTSGRDGI